MFNFTATVEIGAQSCSSLCRHSLAGSHQELAVKWTERGPLGKTPASTLHVSNLGVLVCVCV